MEFYRAAGEAGEMGLCVEERDETRAGEKETRKLTCCVAAATELVVLRGKKPPPKNSRMARSNSSGSLTPACKSVISLER